MSSSSVKLEVSFRRLFGDVCWTTSWCRVNIRLTFGVDSSDGSNEFVLKILFHFNIKWLDFTLMNYWNENWIAYHLVNSSRKKKRTSINDWERTLSNLFSFWMFIKEVYDFVFLMQLLIDLLRIDYDYYIHSFHHHLNPN